MKHERIPRDKAGRFIGGTPRLAARRKREEEGIQRQIIAWCGFCLRRDVLIFSVPNESKRPPSQAATLKAMGLRPGAADLVMVHDGRCYFIECKANDGDQSKAQQAFEHDARLAGSSYRIVRSLAQFIEALGDWGIPSREVRK